MRRGIAGLLIGLIVGGGAAALATAGPSSPVSALAGRYSWHFLNGEVGGSTYYSDDVAEIVPVDTTHAYLRFQLAFYNGHECSLAGVAEAHGSTLVYTAPVDANIGAERCNLTVQRAGAKLFWDDGGTCKAYCGARGSFSHGDLPWASRRPISYLPRLRTSRAYRDALTEWHTGHAVP